MKKFRSALTENLKAEKKTLVVIYYAGHGVMLKNENNIVLLEENENKRLYRLEQHSRALSKFKGSYILTIFDCCREYMAPAV